MSVFMALVVGYVMGAKSGGKELDQLRRSVKVLCQTEEFAGVVVATRAQIASTLRDLASIVDPGPSLAETADLVSRVRHLVGEN